MVNAKHDDTECCSGCLATVGQRITIARNGCELTVDPNALGLAPLDQPNDAASGPAVERAPCANKHFHSTYLNTHSCLEFQIDICVDEANAYVQARSLSKFIEELASWNVLPLLLRLRLVLRRVPASPWILRHYTSTVTRLAAVLGASERLWSQRLRWEWSTRIETPECDWSPILSFVEEECRGRLELRWDETEAGLSFSHMPGATDAVRRLALTKLVDAGFSCSVRCRFRTPNWLEAWVKDRLVDGVSAIAVEPALIRMSGSGVGAWAPVGDAVEFARVVAGMTDHLGLLLGESEPWAEIMRDALTPLFQRRSWPKWARRSTLCASGRWAASEWHSLSGDEHNNPSLMDALSSVQAHPIGVPHDRAVLLNDDKRLAACVACPFELVCESYWDEQRDLLLRHGLHDAADAAYTYQCKLRMSLLGDVLDAVAANQDASAARRDQATRVAKFENGAVSVAAPVVLPPRE